MNVEYKKALKHITKGNIVVFPTDTVTGVGCSMGDTEAIEKLYDIKGRSFKKPTAVLISDLEMFRTLISCEEDSFLKKITEKYWPGKLTIVLDASVIVPSIIMGNSRKVGVRMPKHEKIIKLIKELGRPLVATSANFKGEKAPVLFSEVDSLFLNKVDFYIREDSKGNQASTVIDYLGNSNFDYIRKGYVILD